MKSTASIVACALAFALASTAHAGVVYTTVQRDAAGGELSTTTLSIQNKQLRVEQVDTGKQQPEHTVIFKDGGLLMLDNEKKTYAAMDKAAMQKLAGTANEAMKQLEQAMAGMSEEQKAMMQKMMGKNMPDTNKPKLAPLQFRNTGRTEKAGEYTCRLWEGTRGGAVLWQHCVVDFNKVTGSQEALDTLKAMSAMMEEFVRGMNAPWLQEAMGNAWEGVKEIDGYPVLTREFKDGKPDTVTTLQSARTATLEAGVFAQPAGYKRKDFDLQ